MSLIKIASGAKVHLEDKVIFEVPLPSGGGGEEQNALQFNGQDLQYNGETLTFNP